jgi:uncharacterized protein with FMN-binding domain
MKLGKRITTATIAGLWLAGCATTEPPTPPSTSDSAGYADGDYDATGWYGGQPSRIGVTVTLADSVITDVRITTYATDPTSLDYQEDFAEEISAVVVGKNIDEANVSRVAGASGCSEGFNAALEEIRADAAR